MIKIIKNIISRFVKLLDALINNAKKIPWILGRYAFLFILIFILLDLLFGGFLFYRYLFLVKNKEPQITSIQAKFKEETYQSVLSSWQAREESFNNSSGLNYQNPFK
ncbi:MAG: hypothetical protein A3F47_01440 [Candidatus Staskawiczbacteria bacterium RIFCSPHIGHO2_12_FULL_38_11]|uniref:Uncharacterized protein n=1 Tax=Candidatus Staskawiczbacteria bacterium RIFCSPHIGHO2_12_FULL_38_11 TaxID=1802209 RepID=A0A1G2I7I9_9BACT|nr:MAG: hypothetical protein A3F47_01440 [Candidatus Staskawiczbacteria bacterium RIFCSPHIGHO2_12_FULL_38_11]